MKRVSDTNLRLVTLLSIILLSNGAAAQNRPPSPDPVLSAEAQAERDGRLVDAENILRAAILDTEQREPESARLAVLLNRLASVYRRKGHYADATLAAERALEIDRKAFGAESLRVAMDLNNLSAYYDLQGKTAKRGEVLKQALDLARKDPGSEAHILLLVLYNLSALYTEQQYPARAIPLLEEAVQVCEAQPEARLPSCAEIRGSLAFAYQRAGRAEDADRIASDTVERGQSSSRAWHDDVVNLEVLARQYEQNHADDLAEATYQKAIAMIEKSLGADDPTYLPGELQQLGDLLEREGRNPEAEQLFKRALELRERAVEPRQALRAAYLPYHRLVGLYRTEGRLGEMESTLRRVLELQEKMLGPQHAALVETLLALADVYKEEEKYADADPLYQRALEIQEQNVGADTRQILGALGRYAYLLRKMNEPTRAQAIEARAQALRDKLAEQNKK